MLFAGLSPAARALLEHPPSCCRWPIGDGWCPRKAVAGSYCREHKLASIAENQQPASPQTIARWLHFMSLRMMAGQAGRRFKRAA